MTIELGEQFIVHLKVSVMLGIVIAFPYIFYEIWRFIKPGLYPNEQKAARGNMPINVPDMVSCAPNRFTYMVLDGSTM